jgi:hypothetical protein
LGYGSGTDNGPAVQRGHCALTEEMQSAARVVTIKIRKEELNMKGIRFNVESPRGETGEGRFKSGQPL